MDEAWHSHSSASLQASRDKDDQIESKFQGVAPTLE